MLTLLYTYTKVRFEISSLKIVVSVRVKSEVVEEPSQRIGINICTNTVLHAAREVLVVYDDGYGKKERIRNKLVHSSM